MIGEAGAWRRLDEQGIGLEQLWQSKEWLRHCLAEHWQGLELRWRGAYSKMTPGHTPYL